MFQINVNSSDDFLAEKIFQVPINVSGTISVGNHKLVYDKEIKLWHTTLFLFKKANSSLVKKILNTSMTNKLMSDKCFSIYGINIILQESIQVITSLIPMLVENLIVNNSLIGIIANDNSYTFLFLCVMENTNESFVLQINNDGDISYFNKNIMFATTMFSYITINYDVKLNWMIRSYENKTVLEKKIFD